MPIFRDSRKVQVFGSSLAITLPSDFVKACEIEKGAEMRVLYDLEGVLVASNVESDEGLREGLLKMLDGLKAEELDISS